MYLSTPYKLMYDTKEYPFREIITNIFELYNYNSNIENIHSLQKYDILSREKDQSTKWHQLYYQKYENEFKPTYLKLINDLKKKFNYSEIIYQKVPTIRVQLADGNFGVGEWHKDKTYNHGVSEVNFWLPFVDTNSENTIWIESVEDKGDYMPYTVKYGEILVFDGANLFHGNKPNTSSETRVSVDFRMIDPVRFIPNQNTTINTNIKFDLGGYFEKM